MRRFTKYGLVLLLLLSGLTQSVYAQFDKDVFYWRGRQALADGKYAQSIENFNILARLDTSDCYTFFYRGIAKFNLGDLRGAYDDFDRSIVLNPVFTSGYHYKAITESRFGRYDEALSNLQRAIELRPGFTGLYFSRGVTYFLARQFDKAIKDFDKYIRKEPKDPSAYLNRGASYLFLSDTTRALEDYNKAIKLNRFDTEGYVRRGRLYAEQGRYDDAVNDLNHAIELDSSNTLAYFNRALLLAERKEFIKAMDDLNRVLRDEPGNALTIYNRALISAQVGEYEAALNDLDRVLNINPENVLAYFNRASIFIELERWRDALADYDTAIELYPDFAKAYMNRSYVKNRLGMTKSSKEDYKTAQRKVQEYRAKNVTDAGSFADTTKKYSALIALDADFAKKDFNDELLQHRDIDIRLRPLYRYVFDMDKDDMNYALVHKAEHRLQQRFEKTIAEISSVNISVAGTDKKISASQIAAIDALIASRSASASTTAFLNSISETYQKKYSQALASLDKAIELAGRPGPDTDSYESYYKAYYLMNRAVLRSEMIDFIASMQSNVQVLTMDDSRNTRARVKEQVTTSYDYSEAIADAEAAVKIIDNQPYFHFNLGNLYCLSSDHIASIESYGRAISLYPYMGDAYFNRGLVLIYLKDREKGCIDLSRAGELGVEDAYAVIKKYCEEEGE